MSGVAKSPELPPNPFLGPRPIERENKVAVARPLILLTGVVRRRRSLVSP
jgi:hypothetical protein